MNPKITVAMPFHNASRYLAEAVESVLRQDASFELLLCDDGSTDGGYAIAAALARRDPRVKIVRNAVKRGPAYSRNRILRLSRGEYFAPHDADDIMLAGRLSAQSLILDRHPEIGVVFGHILTIREDWGPKAKPVFAETVTPSGVRALRRRGKVTTYPLIAHGSALFRTALAREVGGYPEHLSLGEDRILFRKLWGRAGFYCLDRFLYVHRFHRASLTARCRDRHSRFSNAKLRKSFPRPRVTVAVPVYNGAPYLAESLESVLRQSFENFEIIIHDDGSADGSFEIAKRFERVDPRIRVYRGRGHRGVAHARNQILKRARGNYFTLQDADDVMLAGRLKIQVKAFEKHPEAGLVFGHCFVMRDRKRKIEKTMNAFEIRGPRQRRLRREGFVDAPCWFPNASAMFKTALARRAGGYDETIRVGSDQEIFPRLRKMTRFYFVDQYFFIYRLHAQSLTARHDRTLALRKDRMEKSRRARFKRLKKRLAFDLHEWRIEIESEREHFLKIIRKYLSFYTGPSARAPERPARKIRMEVHYRSVPELERSGELDAHRRGLLQTYGRTCFVDARGVLVMYILKNQERSDAQIYHACFLNPLHQRMGSDGAVLAHAALLQGPRGGVLILGNDGDGKSTLAGLLAVRGLCYFSDEHAILNQKNGAVKGFAFANAIGITPQAKTHFGDVARSLKWDRRTAKYIFKPWENNLGNVGGVCRVQTLIFPHFIPGEKFKVERVSPRTAARRLRDDMFAKQTRGSQGPFQQRLFRALAAQAEAFSVRYGEKDAITVARWILDRERKKNESK